MDKLSIFLIFIICKLGGEKPLQYTVRKYLEFSNKNCAVATDMKCPRPELSFWLYTRATKDTPTKLELDSLLTAPFVDAPLKIFVQEYGGSTERSIINFNLIPAYFSRGEYNIISVDWAVLMKKPCYYGAWQSIPTVAHCIGQFFQALLAVRTFSSVHMLGFSLGGQVAAWASNEIKGLTRFTGLDLALPMFGVDSPHLKKAVAQFVDIYYTNSGVKGTLDSDGDVNIHYNVGPFQPGCKCDENCSHRRTVRFFAESISAGGLKAFPCEGRSHYRNDLCPVPSANDLVTVGEDMDPTTKHGRYMVFTSDKSPFILDPAVYLDKTTFFNFKKTASGECITYNALISLYDSFGRITGFYGPKKG